MDAPDTKANKPVAKPIGVGPFPIAIRSRSALTVCAPTSSTT